MTNTNLVFVAEVRETRYSKQQRGQQRQTPRKKTFPPPTVLVGTDWTPRRRQVPVACVSVGVYVCRILEQQHEIKFLVQKDTVANSHVILDCRQTRSPLVPPSTSFLCASSNQDTKENLFSSRHYNRKNKEPNTLSFTYRLSTLVADCLSTIKPEGTCTCR